MGDFLKGPLPDDVDTQLRRHLHLHRKIDTFAHENKHFKASCKRLNSHYRYGRGILIDVFYDHFLACHWLDYSTVSLANFSHVVYAGLNDNQSVLPAGLQNLLPRMERDNWLVSYADEPVVGTVLSSLERRLKHRLPLALGFEDLQEKRELLEADFRAFMHEATSFVSDWKAEN